MLDTILAWISDILGELIDAVISTFLGCFTCDLSEIASMFPFFVIGYRIFQAIGLGLILCISVFELLQFFAPGTGRVSDTPARIVVRAGMAGFMLYFGNYLLELILNLARYPFQAMVEANGAAFPFAFAGLGLEDLLLSSAVGGSTVILFGIIIMLLIGWNIIKLMIEIMERYVMIGVLAFSAPLIYPTITSSSTMTIFRKWMGMFAGQCMIMTISAWLLKVIISGFEMNASAGGSTFFQLIAVLAMCKIAQRADTYMQQLGIGVATTGGNLLDEVVGVAMAAQRLAGVTRHRANNKDVLGADADGNLTRSRFGGVLGGMSNTVQGAFNRWKNGESVASVAHNAGKDFETGTGFTFGTTIKEGASEIKNGFTNLATGKGSVKDSVKDVVTGSEKVVRGAAGSVVASGPAVNAYRKVQSVRSAAMDVGGTGEAAGVGRSSFYREAYNGARHFNQEAARYADVRPEDGASINADVVTDDMRSKYRDMGVTAEQYMSYNRAKFGIGGIENGEVDEVARNNGISWDNNPDSLIWGSNEKVGDFGAANYQDLGLADNVDMNAAMIRTIEEGDASIAEQMLFNPTAELRGNDQLGNALLKKVLPEQELTGHTGGEFSNIHAMQSDDPNSGRRITMDYTYADDAGRIHTKHMEVASDNYLAHHTGEGEGQYTKMEQVGMAGIRSEATGEQFWIKGKDDRHETVQEPYRYRRTPPEQPDVPDDSAITDGHVLPAGHTEYSLPGNTEPETRFDPYAPLTETERQTARDHIIGRGYEGDVTLSGTEQAPRYSGSMENVSSYIAEGASKFKDHPAEQTAAVNTIRTSSPEFSRKILDTINEDGSSDIRKLELKDNDELATEILRKGYGDQLPESVDGYHNVRKVKMEEGEQAICFDATQLLPGGMTSKHTYFLTTPTRASSKQGVTRRPQSTEQMKEYRDESGQIFFVSDFPVKTQEVSMPKDLMGKKAKKRRSWRR